MELTDEDYLERRQRAVEGMCRVIEEEGLSLAEAFVAAYTVAASAAGLLEIGVGELAERLGMKGGEK